MAIPLIPQTELRSYYPDGFESPYVSDYTRLANRMLRRMMREDVSGMAGTDLRDLCVQLTLYFEDVLSDVGIWAAFTDLMHERYGRFLPFYDPDPATYLRDEPNLEDVQLLTWMTLRWQREDGLSPLDPLVMRLSRAAYAEMAESFEQMPVNEDLYACFATDPIDHDYDLLCERLSFLVFDCYLTRNPLAYNFLYVNEAISGGDDEYDSDLVAQTMTFTWKGGPLALQAKEWLAAILRHHGRQSEADDVLGMQFRYSMGYRVTGIEGNLIGLEGNDGGHVDIDWNNTFLDEDELPSVKSAVCEFVSFRGEWHTSGFEGWFDDLEGYEEGRSQWEKKQRQWPGYDSLIAENGGSKLFYFENLWRMGDFLRERLDYNDIEFIKKQHSEELWDAPWVLMLPTAQDMFEVCPDIAGCIKDERNPYYNTEFATNCGAEIMPEISLRLAQYLISNGLLPDASFAPTHKGGAPDRALFQDNIDFIVRCCTNTMA